MAVLKRAIQERQQLFMHRHLLLMHHLPEYQPQRQSKFEQIFSLISRKLQISISHLLIQIYKSLFAI